MPETVNQGATTDGTQGTAPVQGQAAPEKPETPERTFTQAEVNAMIEGRLARAGESARMELQKATERADKLQKELEGMKEADKIRAIRDQVSMETGVPASLLTGSDEESCKTQAEAIKAYAAPKYPTVQDGGEVTVNTKGSPRDQFAAWFEAQQK